MAIGNLQEVQKIALGRQREMKAYTLYFDLSEFATKFGSGKAIMVHKRPKDSKPYIVKTTTSGNTLSWKIEQVDVWNSGEGQAEIRWIMDTNGDNETDRIIKSATFTTEIERSIVDDTEECDDAVVYMVDASEMISDVDKIKRDVKTLNDGGLIIKDSVIKGEIDDWLDEHPEATTTVQDRSLTQEKLIVGTLGFVTPEMYGAKADGATDDTTAIQAALDSDVSTVLFNGNYKMSRVVCRKEKVLYFDPDSVVKSTYTSTSNYEGAFNFVGSAGDDVTVNSWTGNKFTANVNLEVGDVVIMSVDVDEYATDPANPNTKYRGLYKVIGVEDGAFYLDCNIPYGNVTKVKKVNQLKNVTVYGNGARFEMTNTAMRGDVFAFKYCENAIVSNISVKNSYGKAVSMYGCHGSMVTECDWTGNKNTSNYEQPLGEAFIMSNCSNCAYKSCTATNSARGFDFAGSIYCRCIECTAVNARFTTHGLYSMYCYFDNCVSYGGNTGQSGSYCFGNGSMGWDKNIYVNNCRVVRCGTNYFVYITQNSDNIYINNCYMVGSGQGQRGVSVSSITDDNCVHVYIRDCVFENCQYDVVINENVEDSVVEVDSCRFDDFASSSGIAFNGAGKWIVRNCGGNLGGNKVFSANGSAKLEGCTFGKNGSGNIYIKDGSGFTGDIEVRNCNMPRFGIRASNTSGETISDVFITNSSLLNMLIYLDGEESENVHVMWNRFTGTVRSKNLVDESKNIYMQNNIYS